MLNSRTHPNPLDLAPPPPPLISLLFVCHVSCTDWFPTMLDMSGIRIDRSTTSTTATTYASRTSAAATSASTTVSTVSPFVYAPASTTGNNPDTGIIHTHTLSRNPLSTTPFNTPSQPTNSPFNLFRTTADGSKSLAHDGVSHWATFRGLFATTTPARTKMLYNSFVGITGANRDNNAH